MSKHARQVGPVGVSVGIFWHIYIEGTTSPTIRLTKLFIRRSSIRIPLTNLYSCPNSVVAGEPFPGTATSDCELPQFPLIGLASKHLKIRNRIKITPPVHVCHVFVF
jgi:hypothetical protein